MKRCSWQLRVGLWTPSSHFGCAILSTMKEGGAKKILGLVTLVAIIGIFAFTKHAFAVTPSAAAVPQTSGAASQIGEIILNGLGTLLGELVNFMGRLIILLVSILVSFASYNNFIHAQPVEIGWVLMRDTANMFFIVILLVSAFSTIIGYKAFHYSGILPKLLLMAVLINFSKTLVGLMIDFSQVLMLTFVNAFRQAAGGNFVSALKLSSVTAIGGNPTDDAYKVDSNLIPAALLAVMMLGISMTLLVIMIAFIVARIIGLWLLLIMSPMAFFSLALPGKLSKAMSMFTGKFWDRLGSLLIGGPVMAFFLWLALAVAQSPNNGFGDLYKPTDETKSANFVTKAGTSPEIASFIVAVAMMLAGVQYAVETSSQVSSALGSFAKQASSGGGVAVQLARGTARLTGSAARLGFEGADRVADIRGFVGRQGLKVNQKLGSALGVTVGEEAFANLASAKGNRQKAEDEAHLKAIKAVPGSLRGNYTRKLADSGDQVAQMELAESATSGLGIKKRTDAFKAQLKKDPAWNGRTDADIAAQAELMATKQAGEDLKRGVTVATTRNDETRLDKFKESIKKNPAFNSDLGDLKTVMGASIEEPLRHLNTINNESMKDSANVVAQAVAMGLIDRATGEVISRDDDGTTDANSTAQVWEKFKSGNRGKLVNAALANLHPEEIKTMIAGIDGDKEAAQRANAFRQFSTLDDQGRVHSVAYNQPANVNPTVIMRNEAVIAQNREEFNQLRNQGGYAANRDEMTARQTGMLAAGATIGETYAFNAQSQTFDDQDNRQAFRAAVQNMNERTMAGDAAALHTISRFDVETLAQNPNGYNDARAAFIEQVNPDALRQGFETARATGNREAQSQIRKMVDIIVKEGERAQGNLQAANVTTDEARQVAADPASVAAAPVVQRMIETHVVQNQAEAHSAARAVISRDQIVNNPELRAMREGLAAGTERAAARRGVGRNFRDRRRGAGGGGAAGGGAAGGAGGPAVT